MEVEDVSEEVKREAQHVAAFFGAHVWEQDFYNSRQGALRVARAFGVVEWEQNCSDSRPPLWEFCGWVDDVRFGWSIWGPNRTLEIMQISRHEEQSSYISGDKLELSSEDFHLNNLMARGLYRLGFEDEGVLSQLPPLTNHEKLELRLSMPPEFWPKTWLERVGE